MPLRQNALRRVALVITSPLRCKALQCSQDFPESSFRDSLDRCREYGLLMVSGPLEQFPAGISNEYLGAGCVRPRRSSADETFHFEGFKKLNRRRLLTIEVLQTIGETDIVDQCNESGQRCGS